MKILNILLIIIVLGAIATGVCMLQSRAEDLSDKKETMEIKVYFIDTQVAYEKDCRVTKEFTRIISKTQAVGTAAINAMLEGPIPSESLVAHNSIPSGAQLLSLEIKDGVAYADFSSELDPMSGSCAVSAIRSQIENTLKQFATIDSVVISVEGETENILQP